MNLSTKFIFPLFESICLIDGKIKNAQFHADRFQRSYRKFFWQSPEFELLSDIEIPKEFCHGKVKLRIGYNRFEKKYGFERYQNREIKTLKLIVHNTIDYDLKFENREQLNQLFRLKKNCDDILIIKNGNITDSSYANIIFWDGSNWYTPSTFLLEGTKRSYLLDNGSIKEVNIQKSDLKTFQGFQLINALLDFDPNFYIPIGNIIP